MKNRLIVLLGPTASGKTALAVRLALTLHTEIVSADSRQVYKEMMIGTAKPSAEDLDRIPHHFIGTRSVQDEYNAGQFGREALGLVEVLFRSHQDVILCGGSGLYIKAVCEGLDDMPEVPAGMREKIMNEYREKGLTWLQQQVEDSDPDYFASVDRNNPHRLVRALELNYTTGRPVRDLRSSAALQHNFDIIKIGVDLERDELYARIDARADTMMEAGLLEEATRLYPLRHLNALQTVGYQEFFDFLDGKQDRAEAIRLLKRNTRRYAKRQLTWFRKDPTIKWVRPGQFEEILNILAPRPPHEL